MPDAAASNRSNLPRHRTWNFPLTADRIVSVLRRPATAIAFLALTAETVTADLLYFRRGGEVQLPARREGSRWILDAPGGPVAFEANDFRKVFPHNDPRSEWPARSAASRPDDVGARFALAWWALENGLTAEATATLREVHKLSPSFEPVKSLIKKLDAVTPPLEDPETGGLTSALKVAFRTSRSPHFLLFHQGSEEEASERLMLIEQVYITYYLTLAGQGLDLPGPRRRLAGVVFTSRDDYLAFLRRENAPAYATTMGYYHPTRGLVVAYDPRDQPAYRTSLTALEGRRRELAMWGRTIEQMPKDARLRVEAAGEPERVLGRQAAHAWHEAVGRDLARQSLLLDLQRRSLAFGMAAHETIHQLAAVSSLAPRHRDFPTWLHEGLAAQFEVVRGGRWAGFGHAHDLRLQDWRSIHLSPRLAPIVRDEGFGEGYRKDLYAEAWALVFFLRKVHPREFAGFLDLLRAPDASGRGEGRVALDHFRTAFGADLSVLESEWHRFMRTVETPLESVP